MEVFYAQNRFINFYVAPISLVERKEKKGARRKQDKNPAPAREELQASVRIAKEEITRLDYIITQFLRAIRPAPLETRLENINDIVRESITFLEPEIKDRDVIVETELRSDLPLLEVDRNQLK